MGKDYFEEGIEITESGDREVETILKSLRNTKFTDLAYAFGYEKGCLMKDADNEENIKKINRVDTNRIIESFDIIEPLVQFLRTNNDVYIKGKAIQEISQLANYIANRLSESEGI